jgi:RNA polymerase sigma-70 factor (ECF subfamily)
LSVPGAASAPVSICDAALVERIRTGDTQAFEAVFHEFYRPLCAFAAGYVRSADGAEELVQELFCRLWEQRTAWRLHGALRTYLYTALRNRALGYLRHRRVVDRVADHASPDAGIPGMGESAPEADARLQAIDAAAVAQRCLDTLSDRCRQALILRRDGDLSYAEIAQVMGVSVKRVEALLTQGYKALRLALAGYR